MTNFSQNNHQTVFVGKDVDKTTGAISAMNDGEIGLFTPGGTTIDNTNDDTGALFQIYLGRGTSQEPLRSPVFSKADVTRVSRKQYTAGTVQLDYIGSNGTTGSIETNNNTVYRAAINVLEGPETNNGGVLVKDMVYSSDASAAQSEIALGLAASGTANFQREAEEAIYFRAICDDAGDALGTGMDTMVWTKGSKIVSATDVDDATTNPAIAVGGFLRAGTTVTSDVYKIVAIDTTANTITLDAPFRGDSVTGVDTAFESITAADGAAANWGVSLTGQTMDWVNGKVTNKVSRWNLSLDSDSFGATTLVNSTTASLGTGSYRQVAELEWFANGNNGDIYRNEAKNSFDFTAMADSAENYDVLEVTIDKGRSGLIATSNPQVISMFITSGKSASSHYALGATADDITDMLEGLLAGVPIYGGASTADGGELAAGDLALTDD